MSLFLRLAALVSGGRMPGGHSPRLAPPAAWAGSGQLAKVVYGDIFGTDKLPVTRWEAMRVPAVCAARWYITTVVSRFPLSVFDAAEVVAAEREDRPARPQDRQPAWLTRTDSDVAPQTRLLWTLDDLLFYGAALWEVTRDGAGAITDAVRVPPERWDIDTDGDDAMVTMDGHRPEPSRVIYFPGPQDPLLDIASRTIRASGGLEDAWAQRVKDPLPLVAITETEDLGLTTDEQKDRVRSYIDARHSPEGAVLYVPWGNKVEVEGKVEPQMYIEARNGAVLDVARFTGLPASLLNASPTNASLTYSTTVSNRSELIDLGLAPWAGAIEARLSMDDCTPQGACVRVDLSSMVHSTDPTNPPTRD